MAATFLNLGLIYIAIILFVLGYYYIAKAVVSYKQTSVKEKTDNPSAAVNKPNIIPLPDNIAAVSTISHKKVDEEIKAIIKTTTSIIKIGGNSDSIIPVITPASITTKNEIKEDIKSSPIIEPEHALYPIPSIITSPLPNKKEIKEEIIFFEEMIASAIEIQNHPHPIIPIHEKKNSTVNQQTGIYKPQLALFKQNTQAGKRVNTGLIKTIYYFGCEEGYSISNPTIDIIFKHRFVDVSGGISGAGIIAPCYLSKQTFDNNTRFVITTGILLPGNYIFIQTISTQHLQIETLKIHS